MPILEELVETVCANPKCNIVTKVLPKEADKSIYCSGNCRIICGDYRWSQGSYSLRKSDKHKARLVREERWRIEQLKRDERQLNGGALWRGEI